MIEDNFKKMCDRMGGEYIKSIDPQCILNLSKFLQQEMADRIRLCRLKAVYACEDKVIKLQ